MQYTGNSTLFPAWFEEFLQHLSLDRVLTDVRWLATEAPERLSGTNQADRAAKYVGSQLADAGIEVHFDEVPGFLSLPESASLTLLSPEHDDIEAWPFAHSGSTQEPRAGDVVYLGSGGEDDYAGVDVAGKIVLVELSYAPPRPEKVRLAASHGALGVVMMNWGEDDSILIPHGTCKPVWGNPEPGDMGQMPDLPAIGISRRDGVRIRNLVQGGNLVHVVLESRTSRSWRTMLQPRAIIRAPEASNPDGEIVILCGHMDSWPVGATDNATGNAVVIELARGLYRIRERLRRDVWLLFWQGHENGIMAGSSWFVDHFWDELKDQAVAHLNLDTPGMIDSSVWRTNSSSELVRFHEAIEVALLEDRPRIRGRVPRTGDQSFFGLGVPSLTGRTTHTTEQIARWNGATLGWWYHSKEDTLDKIDTELLAVAMRVYAGYAVALTTQPILPYDFRLATEEIRHQLLELEEELLGSPELITALDLGSALASCDRLMAAAEKVAQSGLPNGVTDDVLTSQWNKTMMAVARVLIPVKHTVKGRYGQDSYGLSATASELPGLHDLHHLARLSASSQGYHQLLTAVRRQRNRLVDAVQDAAKLLESLPS